MSHYELTSPTLGCGRLPEHQGCCDGQPCCDREIIDATLQDCCDFDGVTRAFNLRGEICCSGVRAKATHGCCPAGDRYGTPFLKADHWCCYDEVRNRHHGSHSPGPHDRPDPECQGPHLKK